MALTYAWASNSGFWRKFTMNLASQPLYASRGRSGNAFGSYRLTGHCIADGPLASDQKNSLPAAAWFPNGADHRLSATVHHLVRVWDFA